MGRGVGGSSPSPEPFDSRRWRHAAVACTPLSRGRPTPRQRMMRRRRGRQLLLHIDRHTRHTATLNTLHSHTASRGRARPCRGCPMRPCTGTLSMCHEYPLPLPSERAQACAGARSACTLQAARWWPSRRAYDRTVSISWLPREPSAIRPARVACFPMLPSATKSFAHAAASPEHERRDWLQAAPYVLLMLCAVVCCPGLASPSTSTCLR